MKADVDIKLRRLANVDLDAANAVVAAAIMTWDLSERIKRLSLASYRYDVHDLEHLTIMGAVDAAEAIIGVAAWEPASVADTHPNLAKRHISPHSAPLDSHAYAAVRRGLQCDRALAGP